MTFLDDNDQKFLFRRLSDLTEKGDEKEKQALINWLTNAMKVPKRRSR